jgi:hypothetical protein
MAGMVGKMDLGASEAMMISLGFGRIPHINTGGVMEVIPVETTLVWEKEMMFV